MTELMVRVKVSGDVADLLRAFRQGEDAARSLARVGGTVGNGIRPGFQQATADVQALGTASDGAFGKFSKWGGAAVLAGGLTGVSVGFKQVLDLGMSFEQNLNTLGSVADISGAQLELVGDKARELGNDIDLPATSASGAAEAMLELAKGGFTASQAMTAAKGTLTLAAAAQIEGAQAAEIQAAALNAYGLSADKAGFVSDVLANTANAASGEITDMAQGLAQAGGVANMFGVSVEDSAVVLATFAKNGVLGSDAGTSFKQAMLAMTAPTKAQSEAMSVLGLQAYDAQGKFVGWRTITDQLANAQKNLTQEQFQAATSTVFGSDAIRTATFLAKGGVEGYDQLRTAITRQGGAATVAAAQTQGLKGAFGLIKNSLEDVALSLYDRVSPGIEKAARTASEWIPRIADVALPVFDDVMKGASTFASGVGEAWDAFGGAETIDALKDGGLKIMDAVSGAFSGQTKEQVIGLVGELGTDIVGSLLEGVSDITAGAVAFFAPIVSAATDLVERAMPYISEFVEVVVSGASTAAEAAGPLGEKIGALLSELGDSSAVSLFGGALNVVGQALTAVLTVLDPVFAVLGGAIDFVAAMPEPIQAVAIAFAAWLLLRGPLTSMFATVSQQLAFATYQMGVFGGAVRLVQAPIATTTAAARGLWTAMGGWVGVGVTALITAFTLFSVANSDVAASTAAAKDGVDALAASLRESNGVVDESVRKTALANIETAKWGRDLEDNTGIRDYYAKIGSDLSTGIDAILGNKAAIDELNGAYERTRAAMQAVIEADVQYTEGGPAYGARAQAMQVEVEALDRQHEAQLRNNGTLQDAQKQNEESAKAVAGNGQAASMAASEFQNLAYKTGITAEEIQKTGEKAGFSQTQIDRVKDAAGRLSILGDPAEAISTGMQQLSGKAKVAQGSTDVLVASLLQLQDESAAVESTQRDAASAMRALAGSARGVEEANAGVAEAEAKLSDLRNGSASDAAALEDANRSLEDALSGVAEAQADLEEAQTDSAAKYAQDLEDHAKSLADAQDRLADANDRVLDSEKALEKARRQAPEDEEAAARALSDARVDASDAVAAAPTDVAKAERDLAKAKRDQVSAQTDLNAAEAAAGGGSDPEDRAAAERKLADARDKLADANENATEREAALARIRVKSERDVADAQRDVADREQALVDTREESAERILDAEKAVTDARKGSADAQTTLTDVMADVPARTDQVAEAQKRLDDATRKVEESQGNVKRVQEDSIPTAAELAAAERDLAAAKDAVFAASDKQFDAFGRAADASRGLIGQVAGAKLAQGDYQGAVETATAMMALQRDEFIKSAMDAGKTREEAEKLADSYGLIPALVPTVIEQSGAAQVVSSATDVQKALDAIPKRITTEISAAGQTGGSWSIGPDGQLQFKKGMALQENEGTFRATNGAVMRADGGWVTGPGGPREDKVPAWLSPTEFVVNASAAQQWGPLLEWINAGKYANGGVVTAGGAAAPVSASLQGALIGPDTSGITAAWGDVASAVVAAWTQRIAPTLDDLNAGTAAVGDGFAFLAAERAVPAWLGIAGIIATSYQDGIRPTYNDLNAAGAQVGDDMIDLWRGPVTESWAGITATVTDAQRGLTGRVFVDLNAGMSGVGAAGADLAASTAVSWASIGASVSTTLSGQISPAWDRVRAFASETGGFFTGVASGVLAAQAQTTSSIATITGELDKFFGMIDGKAAAPTVTVGAAAAGPAAKAFADGGFVTGPGGPREDKVPALLSDTEYVVNSVATARNRAALDAANYSGATLVPAFADGGFVGDKISGRVQSSLVSGIERAVAAGVDRVVSSVATTVGDGSFTSNGQWGPINPRGLAANASAAQQFITGKWGIDDIGGWRASGSVATSDHPAGKALDVMIANYKTPAGIAQGTSVADWFIGNPSAFGTKYVIWRDRINQNGAWKAYQHPSGNDDTLQHRDHVHLSFLTGAGQFTGAPATGDDNPQAGGGTWLEQQVAKIRGGSPAAAGAVPGDSGARTMNTVDPIANFGPMNMARGTAAMVGPVPPGGAEERWRGLVQSVLGAKGKGDAKNVDNAMYQMHTESSGNPLAYNDYDVNYLNGKPSKGLWQTIPSTFRRWADPGFDTNIWHPESNFRAASNYVDANYGGVFPGHAYRDGGFVTGPGSSRSDSVPAWLSDGEFVVNAASAAQNSGVLDWINRGGDARPSVPMVQAVQQPLGITVATPQVHVYVDGQEFKGMVRVEFADAAAAYTAGRSRR